MRKGTYIEILIVIIKLVSICESLRILYELFQFITFTERDNVLEFVIAAVLEKIHHLTEVVRV